MEKLILTQLVKKL